MFPQGVADPRWLRRILPSKPSAMPKMSAAEGPGSSKASKWKQQSTQLRLAMQANKGGSSSEAAAAMLAETHQVGSFASSLSLAGSWLMVQTTWVVCMKPECAMTERSLAPNQ